MDTFIHPIINSIINNDKYGVVLFLKGCGFESGGESFHGQVFGFANIIPEKGAENGNSKGSVCPAGLRFLVTEEGGKYP